MGGKEGEAGQGEETCGATDGGAEGAANGEGGSEGGGLAGSEGGAATRGENGQMPPVSRHALKKGGRPRGACLRVTVWLSLPGVSQSLKGALEVNTSQIFFPLLWR